jgi:hypothetical protein
MRKPYRERAVEKKKQEWAGMEKKLKTDKLRIGSLLFVHLALFIFLSWHGWGGSAFSFAPFVYLLLAMVLFPVGALVLAFVMNVDVSGAFRDVRDIHGKINDFKARRGIEDGR